MMTDWNYIVIAMSLLLLIFLVWKELKRADRARLIWRIIATIIATISLACMALAVTFNRSKKVDGVKEIILLTDGFNKDSVKSFLKSKSTNYSVYTSDIDVLKSTQSLHAEFLSKDQIFKQADDKGKTIHVFGYGFNTGELEQLNSHPFIFHPSEIPSGLTAINWQQKLTSGDKLTVEGSYNNSSPTAVKLVLTGLQTDLDSVSIPANTRRIFELKAMPKHLGKAIYNVFVIAKDDTIETEEIPVEVTQPKPLRILILAASPDFENKFLAARLSQNGYGIAVRSRISKNKFGKEFFNIADVLTEPLSAGTLNQFDVLIADAAELQAIPKSELQAIQSSIQNNGLGMIVRTDSASKSVSFYAKDLKPNSAEEKNGTVASLFLRNENDAAVKIAIESPVYIQSDAGMQALIQNGRSSVLASRAIYGNGNIITLTLANTYSLLLSGKQDEYNEIWKLLLEKAAKKTATGEAISISPALPKLNEPLSLYFQTDDDMLHTGLVGEDNVYLQQNKWLPFIQNGSYWANNAGWLPVVSATGKTSWLYIYEAKAWSTLYAVKKIRITSLYASKNVPPENKKSAVKKQVPYTIPKIYFFIAFIISAGFLWMEKKLP